MQSFELVQLTQLRPRDESIGRHFCQEPSVALVTGDFFSSTLVALSFEPILSPLAHLPFHKK